MGDEALPAGDGADSGSGGNEQSENDGGSDKKLGVAQNDSDHAGDCAGD